MKPCVDCGEALHNGARRCEKCGAEQSEVFVKEVPATKPLPREPRKPGEQVVRTIIGIVVIALPFALGAAGYCFFGVGGGGAGIFIGLLIQLLADLVAVFLE